ncbi:MULTISPECIES: MBL fold metallo-hydrolase [Alphaproteobacteria]|uniref:MBL fold metallo-hydrolase n=1 Tax=Alphaproteobacteria TaxID=28211 RepID=UPI002FCA8B5C
MLQSRRHILGQLAGAAVAIPASAATSHVADETPGRSGTRLILLGTAGGPRPRRARSATAQVIVVNGAAYVVDCGDGVARQLAVAGIPLRSVRHIFITHQHSDHNADYGNLLSAIWVSGLTTQVDGWGPPPLAEMTRHFFAMSAADIDVRVRDEGRIPLPRLVQAHDVSRAGPVMRDANVTVSAAVVRHPPVVPALAYRIDTADRSIVISGDTSPSDNLVVLAKGADVLVHEALLPARIDEMIGKLPNAERLKASILSHHTTAEQAGWIAQQAGVKLLVLSHLIPAEDPDVPDEEWIAAASKFYRGPIIVGKDLLEI